MRLQIILETPWLFFPAEYAEKARETNPEEIE
jgi:hypothetical protein